MFDGIGHFRENPARGRRIAAAFAGFVFASTFGSALGSPTGELTSSERAAVRSIETISQVQLIYNSSYPDHGFACSMSVLGGTSNAGQATAQAAQLLPPDLISGKKGGYSFKISECKQVTVAEKPMVISFRVFAVPDNPRKGRGFCTNEYMKITVDPNGGTNCTEPLQQ